MCLLGDDSESGRDRHDATQEPHTVCTCMILETATHRHAAYYAPAEHSRLAQLGARWLGRCAQTRRAIPQPDFQDISADLLRRATAAAARYGWHATMKAPFELNNGIETEAIPAAFETLTQCRATLTLPPLTLRHMGDYLALVPQAACEALQTLAFDCVRALHPLAKPLSDPQIAQRRLGSLTPLQDAMLLEWGYPFVGEAFQWHMTLTGSLKALTDDELHRLERAALEWFGPILNQPVELDAICWFVEPKAGGDFFEAQRFLLGHP